MSFPYRIKNTADYKNAYNKSTEDPEAFWENIAEHFTWRKKWDSVLRWNFRDPAVRWFEGARLNITENCIDRHLKKNGNNVALIW